METNRIVPSKDMIAFRRTKSLTERILHQAWSIWLRRRADLLLPASKKPRSVRQTARASYDLTKPCYKLAMITGPVNWVLACPSIVQPQEKAMKESQFALPTRRRTIFDGSYGNVIGRLFANLQALYLKQHVWRKEHHEGNGISITNLQIEVFSHTRHSSIGDLFLSVSVIKKESNALPHSHDR